MRGVLILKLLVFVVSCQPTPAEFVDMCMSSPEVLHDMEKITKDVSNTLSEFHVRHWLEGGTLLGAYRFASFIPYDDDVDFGVMGKDYSIHKADIHARLSEKGYDILSWDVDPNGDIIPQVVFKDDLQRPHLDLFLFEPYRYKSNHLKYSSAFWHPIAKHAVHEGLGFPKEIIFNENGSLGTIRLLDREYNAPVNVVAYFKRLYREPKILTNFMMSQAHTGGFCSSRVLIKDIRKNPRSLNKMFDHLERVFEGRYSRTKAPLYEN